MSCVSPDGFILPWASCGGVIGDTIAECICHASVTPKAVTWAAKIDRGMPKAMAGGVIAR